MFPPSMGRPTASRAGLAELYRYSGLGCLFAVVVMLGLGLGWWLDRRLGTVPIFLLLGAFIGATLATVSIYRQVYGERDPDGPRDES